MTPLKNLIELDLRSTQVTDTGLKEIASLRSLRALWLDDKLVTDKAVEELRKDLPKCHFHGRTP